MNHRCKRVRIVTASDPVGRHCPAARRRSLWRRSYIWINVNYLAVRALHHYAQSAGPFQPRAQRIYTELRENLLSTVLGEYGSTPCRAAG